MGLHCGRKNSTPISEEEMKSWREFGEKNRAIREATVWHELECCVCGRPFTSRLADTQECSSCLEAFCE